jgi:hypothetical protein
MCVDVDNEIHRHGYQETGKFRIAGNTPAIATEPLIALARAKLGLSTDTGETNFSRRGLASHPVEHAPLRAASSSG